MKELGLVFQGHVHVVQDIDLVHSVLIGVVHGIEHAVHAHKALRKLDGVLPSHTAVGDVKIFAQVFAWALLNRLHAVIALGTHGGLVHVIQAVGPIRQGLAHVAQNHAQFGKTVKHTRCDDAHGVQASFYAKAVNGAIESALLERLQHLGRQGVGVQIDGRIMGFSGGKNVPKLGVGQIFTLCVRVDHH